MTDIIETVTLKETKKDTILLGYIIGTGEVDGIQIEIQGSGKTLRFRAKYKTGEDSWTREWDLDLRDLAQAVVNEIREAEFARLELRHGL